MNQLATLLSMGSTIAMLCWPICGARSADAETPPPWAFAANPPGLTPPPDDGSVKRVPGSAQEFTLTQIRDLYRPPDWHPEDHPPMPEIVGRGRNPGVYACGYCHLPNGLGRPENASLAGLPASYIVQQMAEFKSGARKSSAPHLLPQAFMLAVAAAAGDTDIAQAAQYFSSLKPQRWITVIETESVPKTEVKGWMLVEAQGGVREPIGERIIEMPQHLERTELRDARSGFTAYVPMGSLAKGAALVTGAAGKRVACTLCHGQDLRGLGPVPALAGRSPSYIVRQLYDLQRGTRNGNWAALMKTAVAQLTLEDMVAIAAYAASLAP
jgi:cytochrome c553